MKFSPSVVFYITAAVAAITVGASTVAGVPADNDACCPPFVYFTCYKCGNPGGIANFDCVIDDRAGILEQSVRDDIVDYIMLPNGDSNVPDHWQDFCTANGQGMNNWKTIGDQPKCDGALVSFASQCGSGGCLPAAVLDNTKCPIAGPDKGLSNFATYGVPLVRSNGICVLDGSNNPYIGGKDDADDVGFNPTPHSASCDANNDHLCLPYDDENTDNGGLHFPPDACTDPPSPTDPPTKAPVHADGDPHFTTWSGEHFDFQGECDLLLVNNPTFKGAVSMHIHGRTKLHGTWSSFSSVAIKMGDDVLEVHGSDAPLINGVQIPIAELEYGAEFLFPLTLAGFSVTVQNTGPTSRRHIVHMGNGERIFINNFKEFVDLEVESPRQIDFLGSSGLLGNYKAGTNLARDGKTIIEEADAFGQEWQVNDSDPQLFTVIDGPQYPTKCIMPPTLTAEQRQLRAMSKKVSEDDAKKACANAKASRMENCIADVFGSDNLDMAGIYEIHSF